jgi:predicted nucleic acid-binding protein
MDELTEGSNVAFDADSLIYFVEHHASFSAILSPVFARVASGTIKGHASFLTLLEVLVSPLRDRIDSLANSYRHLLSQSQGFTLHDVNREIAEQAALVRARWGLRTPDSVVSATALLTGCSHLVTNDSMFRRVTGLNVLVVRDFQ